MKTLDLLRLFAHPRIRGGYPNIIPCLIGPTGTGKSTIVRSLFAELGLKDVRLLLSTMLPEEVTGLPRVVSVGDVLRTEWTVPDWFSEEPIGIFIDELDKANELTIATILTLIAERRLRDKMLHPQTMIVAAMQPVNTALWESSETYKALAARCCFIPVTGYWDYINEKYSIKISLSEEQISAPILPAPSPRQVDWYLQHLHLFLQNNCHRIIARGMFTEEFTNELERLIRGMPQYLDYLIPVLNENPSQIYTLDITEVITIMSRYIDRISAEVLAEGYYRLVTEASIQEIDRMHEEQCRYLFELSEEGTKEVDYTISSAEEIATAMGRIIDKYAQYKEQIEKEKEKEKGGENAKRRRTKESVAK